MFSLAYIQQMNAEANGGGICESCNYLVDTFADTVYIDDGGDETGGICQDCVDAQEAEYRRERLQQLGWD